MMVQWEVLLELFELVDLLVEEQHEEVFFGIDSVQLDVGVAVLEVSLNVKFFARFK